jgi:hypothetical protein
MALVIRGMVSHQQLKGGLSSMDTISMIKLKLDEALTQLCQVPWMYSVHPGKDFTRERKLPFRKVISLLLSFEGAVLSTEMLDYFGYSAEIASTSALVQQRAKIKKEAFQDLFELFVQKTDQINTYKGLRLIAADGSDIRIPKDSNDLDSYYPGSSAQPAYNSLHLSAMYDLLQHTYVDATLVGKKKANERNLLCSMVDRSQLQQALVIADRGYESYNMMAHIQEKGWFYLIRIREAEKFGGITSGLDLPKEAEFDQFFDLTLVNRKTKETSPLLKERNSYKLMRTQLDYLPKKPTKSVAFYKIPFRIVRFQIADGSYETVVTNLDAENFPPMELKKFYHMRWGIETSFRELKYTVGLNCFHAKKVEYIHQEVFARLIMYNFSSLITSSVVIQKKGAKYAHKANFTVAVHVCRQFLRGNVSPPELEAIILRNVSSIRPGRSWPRGSLSKKMISFCYRIA